MIVNRCMKISCVKYKASIGIELLIVSIWCYTAVLVGRFCERLCESIVYRSDRFWNTLQGEHVKQTRWNIRFLENQASDTSTGPPCIGLL